MAFVPTPYSAAGSMSPQPINARLLLLHQLLGPGQQRPVDVPPGQMPPQMQANAAAAAQAAQAALAQMQAAGAPGWDPAGQQLRRVDPGVHDMIAMRYANTPPDGPQHLGSFGHYQPLHPESASSMAAHAAAQAFGQQLAGAHGLQSAISGGGIVPADFLGQHNIPDPHAIHDIAAKLAQRVSRQRIGRNMPSPSLRPHPGIPNPNFNY